MDNSSGHIDSLIINHIQHFLLNTSLTGSVVNTTLVPDTAEVLKEFELTQLTDVDTAIERTIKWYELDFGKKQIG